MDKQEVIESLNSLGVTTNPYEDGVTIVWKGHSIYLPLDLASFLIRGMSKLRVVVEVEDGMVTSVWANDPYIQAAICDKDVQEEGADDIEASAEGYYEIA